MAARFWLGTTNANWGTTANWSDTSGGAGGFSVPTASDDVTLDANGNNACELNASARVCKSLTVTAGYTNTLTMTFGLTVSGDVTLGANMTIAGTSSLTVNASGTLTSNSKTWINALTLSGATFTLADDWTVGGTVTLSGTTPTVNGLFNINCQGSLTNLTTTGIGTSTFVLNGTGTWSTSAPLKHNVTINTAGTITISSSINFNSATLTYISGTVVTGGNTLSCLADTTLDTNGISWTLVQLSGIITLNSLLTATQITITNATTTTTTFAGSNGFNVGTFQSIATGVTSVTFEAGITYDVTTRFLIIGRNDSHVIFNSSIPNSPAFINLDGVIQDVLDIDAVDIDSSGGDSVLNYNGSLLRTQNWFLPGSNSSHTYVF